MRFSNPIESQHTVCDLRREISVTGQPISWHTNENTHRSARVALFVTEEIAPEDTALSG